MSMSSDGISIPCPESDLIRGVVVADDPINISEERIRGMLGGAIGSIIVPAEGASSIIKSISIRWC